MSSRRRRVDPFKAMCGQFIVDARKERRCLDHWMDRRRDVVHKTWFGELGRTRRTTDCFVRFEDGYRMAGLGEGDRGGKPVWARPDDDRVHSI